MCCKRVRKKFIKFPDEEKYKNTKFFTCDISTNQREFTIFVNFLLFFINFGSFSMKKFENCLFRIFMRSMYLRP